MTHILQRLELEWLNDFDVERLNYSDGRYWSKAAQLLPGWTENDPNYCPNFKNHEEVAG